MEQNRDESAPRTAHRAPPDNDSSPPAVRSEPCALSDFIDAWTADTIAAFELAHASATGPCGPEPVGDREAPDPEWVRGTCPACGAELVSNSYYIGGKGYILVWECWQRLGPSPTCDYRRVL